MCPYRMHLGPETSLHMFSIYKSGSVVAYFNFALNQSNYNHVLRR